MITKSFINGLRREQSGDFLGIDEGDNIKIKFAKNVMIKPVYFYYHHKLLRLIKSNAYKDYRLKRR